MRKYRSHPFGHLVRREPGVRVERSEPLVASLACSTFGRLTGAFLSEGVEGLAIAFFNSGLLDIPPPLTVYATPCSVITADRPSHEFLIAAEEEKRTWQSRYRDLLAEVPEIRKHTDLGSRNRTEDELALTELEFHGVLILGGRHVSPDSWPTPEALSGLIDASSAKSGSLQVQAPRSKDSSHSRPG